MATLLTDRFQVILMNGVRLYNRANFNEYVRLNLRQQQLVNVYHIFRQKLNGPEAQSARLEKTANRSHYMA